MKKSIFKKTAAFAASVAMIASMAIPAVAFDTPYSGAGGENNPVVEGNSMIVPKTIYVFNTDGDVLIYEPNVTYTYEVAPGSANKTITGKTLIVEEPDTPTVTVTTRAGLPGGVLLSNAPISETNEGGSSAVLTFGDDTAPATAVTEEGNPREKSITENLYIQAVPSVFNDAAPGVYRYAITQTKGGVNASDVITGSEEDDEDLETVYLDVYVRSIFPEGGEVAVPDIYGLVLSKVDDDINYVENGTDGKQKINEFDPDEYHTVNVSVEKIITGSMADKTHSFPFAITGTATNGSEVYYDEATAGNTLVVGASGYTVPVTELGDGDKVTVYGIPAQCEPTLTATETNDTADTYSAKVDLNDTEVVASAKLAAETGTQTYTDDIIIREGIKVDEIVFTNTLEEISPTGLIFRFAPFAFMVTAGGMLAAVALRGKKRDSEEGMI